MLLPRTTALRLSAMSSGAKMLTSTSSSSSSFLAVRNPSFFSSTSTRLFNGGVLHRGNKNRVSFSSATSFANASLRCYASSTGFDRVQVQNPIVEMDGEFLVALCLVGEEMMENDIFFLKYLNRIFKLGISLLFFLCY